MISDVGRVLTQPDIPHAEPKMGKVAVIYTTPETVISDYARLLDLADYQTALTADINTFLKGLSQGTLEPPALKKLVRQMEQIGRAHV